MCAHMFVPRGSHLALTLLTKWWRGVCRGLFLYNQLRRWRSHCVIPVYSNVAALWVLSLRHPVELLSRSKPVHSCVSPKHFGVCVCKCVWIVGSFHPSSCTSVFVCCVLLNVAVSMRVCGGRASVCVCVWTVSHLLPSPCACAHVDTLSLTTLYAPHPGDTLSSCTAACLSDLLYTICREEPCFYLSPWRPGTSPIPSSLPLSRLFVWGTRLPQNRCPVL